MRCRLPWTWNWLQATIRLKDDQTRRYNAEQQLVNGFFQVLEYHLSPDSGMSGRGLINLLLTDICENNAGDDGFKKKAQEEAAKKAKNLAREMTGAQSLFSKLGFFHIGPIDGHDLSHLLPIFKNLRDRDIF